MIYIDREGKYVTGVRHRHERSSWLLAGGHIMWCYQCGAIRDMKKVLTNGVAFADGSKWRKPTGIGGKNPA